MQGFFLLLSFLALGRRLTLTRKVIEIAGLLNYSGVRLKFLVNEAILTSNFFFKIFFIRVLRTISITEMAIIA